VRLKSTASLSEIDLVKADPELTVRRLLGFDDALFAKTVRGIIGWRAQKTEAEKENAAALAERVRRQVAANAEQQKGWPEQLRREEGRRA
jgi:hypothetical protein